MRKVRPIPCVCSSLILTHILLAWSCHLFNQITSNWLVPLARDGFYSNFMHNLSLSFSLNVRVRERVCIQQSSQFWSNPDADQPLNSIHPKSSEPFWQIQTFTMSGFCRGSIGVWAEKAAMLRTLVFTFIYLKRAFFSLQLICLWTYSLLPPSSSSSSSLSTINLLASPVKTLLYETTELSASHVSRRVRVRRIRTIFLKSIIRSINHQILLTVYCQITFLSYIIYISSSISEIHETLTCIPISCFFFFFFSSSLRVCYFISHYVFATLDACHILLVRFFVARTDLVLPGCNQSFPFVLVTRSFSSGIWERCRYVFMSSCNVTFSNQLKSHVIQSRFANHCQMIYKI